VSGSDDVLRRIEELSRQLDAVKASADETTRILHASRRIVAEVRKQAMVLDTSVSHCAAPKRRRPPKPR
jgi:hypothetical protein